MYLLAAFVPVCVDVMMMSFVCKNICDHFTACGLCRLESTHSSNLGCDVHPHPGPLRYPCSVCFKNVTSQSTCNLCTRCSHWIHSRCSGLREFADYHRANGWICTACRTLPQPRAPYPPPSPAHTPTISDKTFNILQWKANGIGNKQTELSIFLELHNLKMAAIQESKLTAKSRSPNIQNYTLVRQDLCPGGGLLFFIHNSVSFTRKPLSTTSKNDHHLEELSISIAMDNIELRITTVYIYKRISLTS